MSVVMKQKYQVWSFSSELLQIFRDDENKYEYYMWKFSVHKYD